MSTVTLTSNKVVSKPLAAIVYGHLLRWVDGGIAGACTLYDAAMLARDPNFTPSATTEDELSAALLEDGRTHGDIREIVKCAVIGEGYDLRVVSPIASE